MTEEELERLLKNSLWGLWVVKLAMAKKKESRNRRGLQFNCFVLHSPPPSFKENEYLNFLDLLQKKLETFEHETRFQIAIFSSYKNHWTAFDFLIDKEGKLNVFCLDAANDYEGDIALEHIIKKFPNCNAYRLAPDKDLNSKNADHLRLIQTDMYSCSRMTIEHIFLLSKREFLFDANFKNYDEQDGVWLIKPDTLFQHAPELYRSTQIYSILESLIKTSPKSSKKKVSQKGFDLMSYIELRGAQEKIDKANSSKNQTIHYRKRRIQENVREFFKHHGIEYVENLLNKSEQSWKDFLNLPASEKLDYMKGNIKQQSFKNIAINILTKNRNDFQQYIDSKFKNVKSIFKSIESGKLRETLKKIDQGINLLNDLPSSDLPSEIMSNLEKLKLPSAVRKELQTAYDVYTQPLPLPLENSSNKNPML